MPELPEVETTCRGIAPHVQGQTLSEVHVREPRLRWPIDPALAQRLTGLTVRSITRRAKYMLIDLGAGTLIIHLGMSGSLRVLPAGLSVQKHDHVDFVFGDIMLRYHDPRRFGAILWQPGLPEHHALLAHLGPEPLSEAFNGVYLYQATRQRSRAIKPVLMDNHVVVGVGNIYANESLSYAHISPLRTAAHLTRRESEALVQHIKTVLAQAILAGGSTLRDFVNAQGQPGYFQQQYQVYGRAQLPCLCCGTPVCQIKQGQRSSFYCPQCQR